jgi:hypothetical protein
MDCSNRVKVQSMDARFLWRLGMFLPLLILAIGLIPAMGLTLAMDASYETDNFIVSAPCEASARQFAETAEQCRTDLALLWLGKTLPNWSEKCYIKVHVGDNLGAGGTTSFIFENGEVFGWKMEIQGSHERIIDSVLPHEITHMVLASYFRKPIPRWLDEGMATYVEHKDEKANYRRMLRNFLQADVQRCFPLNRLVAMMDYPCDPMPFYAQGFSLVEYLLEYGKTFDDYEHRRLVRFAETAMHSGDWQSELQEHYGIENLGELQTSWVRWVGSDGQAFEEIAGVVSVEPPNLQTPETLVAQTSAKPLPPPPIGRSVYDRHVERIPVTWDDESPVSIPASFGRTVILR